jgi:lipoyl(octanoyl) transferase
MQRVYFTDLGQMDYKNAWDYQEQLLRANVEAKTAQRNAIAAEKSGNTQNVWEVAHADASPLTADGSPLPPQHSAFTTRHSLIFVEHPPVYTLGKSGHIENILITEAARKKQGIDFFYTNRGGDITFHGPEQIVGYPILDLEKFYTDIGRYLRSLEEVVILTMAAYDLKGERSAGETGVWLEPGVKGQERKICAIGVRCSRWITMHGFAFNINTDLAYFDNIIPCGIQNKQVTSLEHELGRKIDMMEAKEKLKKNFEKVFDVQLVS